MSWDKNEKRRERRAAATESLLPVRFQIEIQNITIPVEAVNYHYLGACLRMPKHLVSTIDKDAPLMINIVMGNKVIEKKMRCRIAWETLSEDGLLGVEFQRETSNLFTRAKRFTTHQHIVPTLVSPDPLNPNRELYFKVLNISQTGIAVQTSLSNRHLLPGLVIKKAILTLPGETPCAIRLKIENTRRSADQGVFQIGLSIQNPEAKMLRRVKTYLSTLSPIPSGRGETLARHSMLSKTVKKGLSFRIISTEDEYQDVLKLRFCGYEMAGKVKPNSDWTDQGEGLKKEGLVLGAYLGGELVASAELRFGDASLPLRFVHQTKEATLSPEEIKRLVEINKLVVLPHVQGTDIVLGMIQKMHSMVIQKGNYDVMLSATHQLVPLYQRIGFQRSKFQYDHPFITGLKLEVMKLPHEVMIKVKKIHPLAWTTVYLQTCQFLAEIGVTEPVKLGLFKRMQIYIVPKFIHIKKVITERRQKNKSLAPVTTIPEPNKSPKEAETGT